MFGFTVLTVVTVLTYTNAPPIPRQVVDPTGAVLFTGEEIEGGQEVFLKHALMEHGTLWGHGAYLGPDYTAEYLHREVGIARDVLATARRVGSPSCGSRPITFIPSTMWPPRPGNVPPPVEILRGGELVMITPRL